MAIVTLTILLWPLIALIAWMFTAGICDWRVCCAVRVALVALTAAWVYFLLGALVFGCGW